MAVLSRAGHSLESTTGTHHYQDLRSKTIANVLEKIRALEQERERERRDAQATIDDLCRRLDQEAEERRKLTLILTDQRSQAPASPTEQQPQIESRPLARSWLIVLLIVVVLLAGVFFFLKDYYW